MHSHKEKKKHLKKKAYKMEIRMIFLQAKHFQSLLVKLADTSKRGKEEILS